MSEDTRAGRTVQSVDRALELVRLLAEAPAGLRLSELAEATGVVPQTAQSLVRTLQARDWVIQKGRGKPYELGPAVLRLAAGWRAQHGDTVAIRPDVARLCRRTGEYVLLAELVGGRLVPVIEDRVDRELMVREDAVGTNRLHTMATFQAIVAFRPDPERARLLNGMTFSSWGANSIVTREGFESRLSEIRRTGVAVCRDEAPGHTSALAVPIRGRGGQVRHALGISLPTVRFDREREQALVARLRSTAADIEARWGTR